MSNLTVADLQALMERMKPVVYYGTQPAVERGKVLCFETRQRWIVVHPDDLDILRTQCPDVRFEHIREAPPEAVEAMLPPLPHPEIHLPPELERTGEILGTSPSRLGLSGIVGLRLAIR